MHQRSLAPSATDKSGAAGQRDLSRRGLNRPARFRTEPTVLAAGIVIWPPPSSRNVLIFFGPQFGYVALAAKIVDTIAGSKACGQWRGARDRFSKPATPSRS